MTHLPGFPHRPLLVPGVLVTRRDDGHLQIGLDPALAVIAPDDPDSRELLTRLREGRAPIVTATTHRLCAELLDRGLVVDADALFADLPPQPTGRHAVAAAYAQSGLDGRAVLARRSTRPVRVEAPAELAELAAGLLQLSGVPTEGAPFAVLLVVLGEPARHRIDALVQADTPHLVVRAGERTIEIGPFVVPGTTACLRCADACLGESDPRRALVVEQYSRVGRHRADGVPMPVDPAVATAAVGWAVRDLVSFVDDEAPSTWSASVRFGRGMHLEHREWSRDPRCGCAWAAAALG